MDVVAPVAVLWPDEDRQWAGVSSRLAPSVVVLTLGEFDPEHETGPATWLRIRVQELAGSASGPIVVYLPGVARRRLLDTQSLEPGLQCLAGLAVQSNVFSQQNSSDWTPLAFFSNQGKGLGLDVASDAGTRSALAACLPALLDIPVDDLRRRRLAATDFQKLLVTDPVRSILLWMNDPAGFEAARAADNSWTSFVHLVQSEWKLSVQHDGPLLGAEMLGAQKGRWAEVWSRFVESPAGYPGVVSLLRRVSNATLPDPLIWPQDNSDAEADLSLALRALAGQPVAHVRAKLGELEEAHGVRRPSIWGQLGEAPVAAVVGQLHELSGVSERQPQGHAPGEIAGDYAEVGWRVDDAFVRSLAVLPIGHELQPVVTAIAESLYLPWLNAATEKFQNAVMADPAWGGPPAGVTPDVPAGTCVMFVDGLRIDVAARVAAQLDSAFDVQVAWGQAAVPTVTATCKPGLTPLAAELGGGADLAPTLGGGQPWAQAVFKRRLAEIGWGYVAQDETGDPAAPGWTEGGDIDTLGHAVGANLVRSLDSEAVSIANRVEELLTSGWREIVLVTDHGWLMVPSKLPKHHLTEHLTSIRKGRCARLRPGVPVPDGVLTLPWSHDADVTIALAPGIYAFDAGRVYDHGGLSLQESIVPRLTVTSRNVSGTRRLTIDISWTSLACVVSVDGAPDGVHADLRSRPADASSSLASGGKKVKDGKARLLAGDEHEGEAAVVVVVGADGTVLAQEPTIVPAG
jgi:hypothetical protein